MATGDTRTPHTLSEVVVPEVAGLFPTGIPAISDFSQCPFHFCGGCTRLPSSQGMPSTERTQCTVLYVSHHRTKTLAMEVYDHTSVCRVVGRLCRSLE